MPVLKVLIPDHHKREFANLLAGFKPNPNRREYKPNVKKRLLGGDDSTIYLLSGEIVSLNSIRNKSQSWDTNDCIILQPETHNLGKG